MSDNNYRYFIYSEQQFAERQKIEAKIGRVFSSGTVSNGRKIRPYTEISKTGKSRYPDADIVAEGILQNMKYTKIGG